ncbi:DHHC-type zinc finger family protein [Euphorbia peplus]|nr:DHHC-type zinc finger family protein [Euphorbia peplus]
MFILISKVRHLCALPSFCLSTRINGFNYYTYTLSPFDGNHGSFYLLLFYCYMANLQKHSLIKSVARHLTDDFHHHPEMSIMVIVVVFTTYVLVLLLLTSGRDPGIIPRNAHPPEPEGFHGNADIGAGKLHNYVCLTLRRWRLMEHM